MRKKSTQKTLTYDDAVRRLEEIVASLEEGQALSMEEFRHSAEEAKSLLDFCQAQLTSLETDLDTLLPPPPAETESE